MSLVDSELAPLRDPQLAALATGAWPVWLWSADGSRILWANAVGAAIFGAASIGGLHERRFKANDTAAAQVIRLGATLPSRAQERLERLRGFGAGFGRALTCVCSRIVRNDGKAAVLIIATEPAGPTLTLGERVRRLFADSEDAIAAFGPDGALIHANAAASARLRGAASLSALGLAGLAVPDSGSVLANAEIEGTSVGITAERLGKDNFRVVLLTLAPQPAQPSPAEPPAREAAAPAPAPVPQAISVPAPAPVVASPPLEGQAEPIADASVADAPAAAQEPAAESTPGSAAADDVPIAVSSVPPAQSEAPIVERRHPLRFVWHMDDDGHFVVGSDEFIELVGPRIMARADRPWREIAGELDLDREGQVACAMATHDTWSGIVVSWPVDASNMRLPVELSGLPVFDRDRTFRGYRGFGVCRDVECINAINRERRERPADVAPASQPEPQPAQTVPAALVAPVIKAVEETAAATTIEPVEMEHSAVSVAAASANVVPFRQSYVSEAKTPPALSPIERRAFRELAQELTARLRGSPDAAADDGAQTEIPETADAAPAAAIELMERRPPAGTVLEQTLLDRIPIGVLLYRHDLLLYANRHFLEWSGYPSLDAIERAGGLNTLFPGPGARPAENHALQTFVIRAQSGGELPAEGRTFTVPWHGSSALALVLTGGNAQAALEKIEHAAAAAENENRALKAILDKTPDGIVMLDPRGVIENANARAAALFGKAQDNMTGCSLGEFLAPESERVAREYFERIVSGSDGDGGTIDVAARAGENRLIPLTLSLTRIGSDRFAAMFHDITANRRSEEELRNARREAAQAVAAKTEFLTKVSHEIRTPLNAITGFTEVIMAERFGPIGNERYREYVRDIHDAAMHLVATLNDLVDLSRIESGKAELNFANVSLNALTQQCVGIMQPQANKARIIIRTALTPALPQVVADERSMRQIVLNLLSNSIKLTGPGGQVIVSTAFSDAREAVLRVRDTGAGMSERDIQAVLEPFHDATTSARFGSGGTGFGLPLTKAIAEANCAHFSISSAPNAGTLVEIAFPPSRVVTE
ncbi:MAG TPA: PAS domain-containing sensor histidine kinase [Xanthobacteraceae bacterium]|nr:PAS domain-containing sensor histidine kinase [Xanthobacteraceae bacterium]